ncbi:MAG TPA: aldo/keto reductase [Cytophagales bacterium]|nr:aldo/keto reductase [Cytophagales bacterium]
MNITNINGTVELNNKVKMPYFGLGTYKAKGGEVKNAVLKALQKGYRLIDTASMYANEDEIGTAIGESNVAREEIFITSKVWNADQGYEQTKKAFRMSLNQLQFEYLDLYLVHWPVAGKYLETWKALEELYDEGLVKAIGVSNFTPEHFEHLKDNCNITPAVNQVEFHPWLLQPELQNYCTKNNIKVQAWGPLMRGNLDELSVLDDIAKKYNKTKAQILLRWDLQMNVLTIPKTVTMSRIEENADIFDFELGEAEVQRISGADAARRLGPDPNNFDF